MAQPHTDRQDCKCKPSYLTSNLNAVSQTPLILGNRMELDFDVEDCALLPHASTGSS